MITCPVCEHRFDEQAYQVVVVGLGSFDSIACVEAALRQKARESKKRARDPGYAFSSDGEGGGPTRTDRTT